MKNRIILFLFCLLPSLISAQRNVEKGFDTLSLVDMQNLFKNDKNHIPEKRYDKIYVPDYFYEPSIMLSSALNDRIAYISQWRIFREGERYLFLEKILPLNGDSLPQASLEFQRIERKYKVGGSAGYKNVPTGYSGIIAEWFSGGLFVLHCPRKLFHTMVSKKALSLTVCKGKLIDEKKVVPKDGLFESSCFPQKGGLVLIREDGCWYDDIENNIKYLMSPLINENFSTDFAKFIGKEYSFLLQIVPETGEVISHFLLSDKLSVDEWKIISYLENQIRKFPPNSFGPLITIDGKLLYGRYFKFIVEKEKFCIEDYLDN